MNARVRKRRLGFAVALVALLLLAGGGLALAQTPYALSWWTVDGGGEESAGGGYTLGGTVGQADAGVLSGGAYTLSGGFWAGGSPPPTKTYSVFVPQVMRP